MNSYFNRFLVRFGFKNYVQKSGQERPWTLTTGVLKQAVGMRNPILEAINAKKRSKCATKLESIVPVLSYNVCTTPLPAQYAAIERPARSVQELSSTPLHAAPIEPQPTKPSSSNQLREWFEAGQTRRERVREWGGGVGTEHIRDPQSIFSLTIWW